MQLIYAIEIDPENYVAESFHKRMLPPAKCPHCSRTKTLWALGYYSRNLSRMTGQTGFDSGDLGLLFNWGSRIWSYGPSIQFPIFEGGRIAANIKEQRATYEENVANYRQSVLVAFQDVENNTGAGAVAGMTVTDDCN